jgi:hypothetical protein
MVIENTLEPMLSLKVSRIRDPEADVFRLTRYEDVEGIKLLFEGREASPNDIQGGHWMITPF